MTEDRHTSEWEAISATALIDGLVPVLPADGVAIVGINGRSRSGKTVLAATLSDAADDVSVVHTDDIAWHHSFFDWTSLLVAGVLEPLRSQGPPISYTPGSWIDRGRPGAIRVSEGTRVVLIEGVGATRRELVPWLDAAIWVETPPELAMQRTRDLDRDPPGFVEDWMRHENAHLDRDRPWSRATVVVSGSDRPQAHSRHFFVTCRGRRQA